MIRDTLIFDAEDGSARFVGTVTPKGTRVVMQDGRLLAVKWPGSSYYSGRGRYLYAPGQWIVFEEVYSGNTRRLMEEDDGYGLPDESGKIKLEVREVLRWPLR